MTGRQADQASALGALLDAVEQARELADRNPNATPSTAGDFLAALFRARDALDAIEGATYREWDEMGRRRPLTWREVGALRGTSSSAAQERGARLVEQLQAKATIREAFEQVDRGE